SPPRVRGPEPRPHLALFPRHRGRRHLHPFPTRRSSDLAQPIDYRRAGTTEVKLAAQASVGLQGNALFRVEGGQGQPVALAFQRQQMSDELARLETLGGMEFGRCGAVAVELAQGIEGVHVAEIDPADLAIVQGVAGAKVPLEQAAEQQGQQRLEELDELALVPCPYRLAGDPGRKQYAVAKA